MKSIYLPWYTDKQNLCNIQIYKSYICIII